MVVRCARPVFSPYHVGARHRAIVVARGVRSGGPSDVQRGPGARHLELVRTGVGRCDSRSQRGVATWYDVARRVYAAGGAARLVQPCSTAQFPTPARRPVRAVLGIARSEQALGGPLRPWEEAIDRFLAEIEVRP